MHPQTIQTAYSCALRDMPWLAAHSGSRQAPLTKLTASGWAPVLDALRQQEDSAVARIMRAADRISTAGTAADSTADPNGPALLSVFTHMNGEHEGQFLPPEAGSGKLTMPVRCHSSIPASVWAAVQKSLESFLLPIEPEADSLGDLLNLLEEQTGGLPAETPGGGDTDISLYDRLKIRTAVGCCISAYLLEQGETDAHSCLKENFSEIPCFLLYSADLSGIQNFIYTIADDKALRSLSGRSFFLGFLMEHYVDELLSGCGLSRANLLYSGGGHCYLLLPNTGTVTECLDRFNLRFNDFLLEQFGASLFLAHGRTACCGNDLMNRPAQKAPYREMFRRVSHAVSAHKLHRYSASQLLRLNRRRNTDERECKICGRSDHLEGELCPWCQRLIGLSEKISHSEVVVTGGAETFRPDFQLPALDGMVGFLFTSQERAEELRDAKADVRRIYAKNKRCTLKGCSTRLYVGEYTAGNQVEELAEKAEGVHRIGVCRMDVDNLGQAFVQGFEGPESEPVESRFRYVTIARTAAFSRQMSLFFQLYINDILSGTYGNQEPLAVRIVYSGGDDVFLLGAWNDVITASERIQQALTTFTAGALTISCGIGVFEQKFPIRLSAAQTAEMEERAKQEPGKNAICLFDPRAKHVYSWSVFREKVRDEKYQTLDTFFQKFQQERGSTFLYRLLDLLRTTEGSGHSINLARYAYQLARLEPKKSDDRWKDYRKFADRMYRWAWNPSDREQLITAIYLYVYQNRGGSKQ